MPPPPNYRACGGADQCVVARCVVLSEKFPDTWDGKPAYTADSWFGGASGNSGTKVSLKPADMD